MRTEPPAAGGLFSTRIARLSTGVKMFGLLSLALLPLGIIMFFASLQSSQIADLERRAALRIALSEGARRVASEIAVDMGTLRVAARALQSGQLAANVCTRTRDILRSVASQPTDFAMLDGTGRQVCATRPILLSQAADRAARPAVAIVDAARQELRIEVTAPGSDYVGIARYSSAQLAALAKPIEFRPDYRLSLSDENGTMVLADTLSAGALQRIEALSVPIARTELSLSMTVRAIPLTSSQVTTMLVPLLMWAAAAAVGWFVVDRLVLRPLSDLQAAVAAYQPGTTFGSAKRMATPAREIRELGDTFRAITETVAAHETELALGLSRQTKLTREVHHRVKNNLQVISSLINLHARGAKSPEAGAAYASIQRRVDALSVVHRNHFAEMEENRGVAIRPLVGEITSNLRATAPADAASFTILIDVAPHYVTQDVAVPLAFMITELVELAMQADAGATIRISVTAGDLADRSRLSIQSAALAGGRALQDRLAQSYGRILEGLARQLRGPLTIDAQEGQYSVTFARIGSD